MNYRPTSLSPPDIVRSAYAELIVSDLSSSRRFWVDTLGFAVTAEDKHTLYLRGYDELTHHNLVLRERPCPLSSRWRSGSGNPRTSPWPRLFTARSVARPSTVQSGLSAV